MSTAWVYGVIGVHPFQLGLFDAEGAGGRVGQGRLDARLLLVPARRQGRARGWGLPTLGALGLLQRLRSLRMDVPRLAHSAARGRRPAGDAHLPAAAQRLPDRARLERVRAAGDRQPRHHRRQAPSCPSTARTARSTASCARTPGQLQNTAPLYRLPWAQVFVRAVSSAAIGALQGALNAFVGIAAKRVSTNTGKSTKLDPFALNAAARTQSAILEMKTVLLRSFEDMMKRIVRAGEDIPMPDRIRYRFESSQVVRRCAVLCDELMPLLGWPRDLHGQPGGALLARHQRSARARGQRSCHHRHLARAPCTSGRTCRSSSSRPGNAPA